MAKPFHTDKNNITWKPKSWLPNQLGFKFLAKRSDGSVVPAEVTVYGTYKQHTVKGIHYRDIIEWSNA